MNGVTRRDFLKALGGFSLVGFSSPLWAKGNGNIRISIIHTTDLHGHIRPTRTYSGTYHVGGLARCATQIAAWQKQNPHHLLLDIGDVYQGTAVGFETRGKVMISCFNHLNYHAWVAGNHEFDWGLDTFVHAVNQSQMPVLACNSFFQGKELDRDLVLPKPLHQLKPWVIHEIAGFRIAVIGLTSPGLPDWLPKQTLGGFAVTDPVDSVRRAMAALTIEKPDAIILAAHMGIRSRGDNFANHIASLATQFPTLSLIIGGHTHQDFPEKMLGPVPYTQAGYFGIWLGRADLIFDRESRTLIGVETQTKSMDSTIPEDPSILSLAAKDLKNANRILYTKVGILKDSLDGKRQRAIPNETEILIGCAIREAMQKRSQPIDGVFHGVFQDDASIPSGEKSVKDIWSILPFENQTVTAELSSLDLRIIMEEVLSGLVSDQRSLIGFKLITRRRGRLWKVDAIVDLDGQPLPPKKRYVIAFNSYDSVSGGRRFHRLAELLLKPEAKMRLHSLQIREALIDFFVTHKEVSRNTLKSWLSATRF